MQQQEPAGGVEPPAGPWTGGSVAGTGSEVGDRVVGPKIAVGVVE